MDTSSSKQSISNVSTTPGGTVVSWEETERNAASGNQQAQCELGCSLWTGTYGNIIDGNYRKVVRLPGKAYDWLLRGTDQTTHGNPTDSTYSFVVAALNALGSYFEIERGDTEEAKMYYQRSADLFVEFGGNLIVLVCQYSMMMLLLSVCFKYHILVPQVTIMYDQKTVSLLIVGIVTFVGDSLFFLLYLWPSPIRCVCSENGWNSFMIYYHWTMRYANPCCGIHI
jgi:hypothetical protein